MRSLSLVLQERIKTPEVLKKLTTLILSNIAYKDIIYSKLNRGNAIIDIFIASIKIIFFKKNIQCFC